MQRFDPQRRSLLRRSVPVLGFALLAPAPLVQAAQMLRTPRQPEGPFYPERIPLDSDNDLITIAGRTTRARGVVTEVTGRVLDERGRPVAAARIEVWQCDANGRYHHSRDRRDAPVDENFQGYGRFTTGADGAYRFRTIEPVPYGSRAPHIHFKIGGDGFSGLTTQMYVADAPQNDRDFLLNRVPESARASLIVKLEENPADSAALVGRFDIVLAADGRFDLES